MRRRKREEENMSKNKRPLRLLNVRNTLVAVLLGTVLVFTATATANGGIFDSVEEVFGFGEDESAGNKESAAAAFTPGNLVIYRVGDGSAGLTSNATAVFLDEYTTSGTLVQSVAMPTSVSGANKRLTASGNSTSEGYLSRSADGQYLLVPGYDAATGTGTITTSTSATINRVIGRVDPGANVDTTTALNDAISGGNPRGAASTNGTDLWISGTSTGGGVRYAAFGATTSTALTSGGVTNLRAVRVAGGQLYVSSGTAGLRLGTVGSGTPTTAGQTITSLPGFPTATGGSPTAPYQFFFADLDSGVAGLDTLYVADDGGNAIEKFSLVGGSWVANGSVTIASVRGITGASSGSTVFLWCTVNGATLQTLTDAGGYNQTISGTPTTLATAATNTAMRGIAFAPQAASSPTPTFTPTPAVDYCNLQFPTSFTVSTSSTSPTIYGDVFEAGVTEPPGPSGSITSQVGWGPHLSDPGIAANGWVWFSTSYNIQNGNNDEYQGTITAPGAAGTYSYTYRFSLDGGVNWTYADIDGNGSNAGLSLDVNQLGTMTVTSSSTATNTATATNTSTDRKSTRLNSSHVS